MKDSTQLNFAFFLCWGSDYLQCRRVDGLQQWVLQRQFLPPLHPDLGVTAQEIKRPQLEWGRPGMQQQRGLCDTLSQGSH